VERNKLRLHEICSYLELPRRTDGRTDGRGQRLTRPSVRRIGVRGCHTKFWNCTLPSVASQAMGHRGACPIDFQLLIFEG